MAWSARARIRRFAVMGWSDREIAEALGCWRGTVGKHRREMGLPSNRHNQRHNAKVAKGIRRFCRRNDCRSLRDVQILSQRIAAAKTGWPIGLALRETQILNLLEDGPKTRNELAETLGLTTGKHALKGSRNGAWLRTLAARGFVRAERRYVGGRRIADLYHLAQRRRAASPYDGEARLVAVSAA